MCIDSVYLARIQKMQATSIFCLCWNHPSADPRSMCYRTTAHSEEKQEHLFEKTELQSNWPHHCSADLFHPTIVQICFMWFVFVCVAVFMSSQIAEQKPDNCNPRRVWAITLLRKSAFWECSMAASIPSWAYQLQGGRSGWAVFCEK